VAHTVVVVSGLGAVGILTGALLASAGASVIGIEPKPERREAATHFGIRPVAPGEAREIVDRSAGGGVPVVVEASGNPDALPGLIDLLAHEGVLLIASWFGAQPVRLPLGTHFHRRRITLRSTQVSSIPAELSKSWSLERRRNTAVNLLRELPLKTLTTHSFPVAMAGEAFAAIDRGEPGLIHAALSYEDVDG